MKAVLEAPARPAHVPEDREAQLLAAWTALCEDTETSIDPDETMEVAGQEMTRLEARIFAETRLYDFAVHVMGWDRLVERLHGQLCDWMEHFLFVSENTVGLIQIPRGMYKTTTATMSLLPWVHLKDAEMGCLFGHASKDKGAIYMKELESHWEESPILRWIAPELVWEKVSQARVWSKSAYFLRRKRRDKVPSVYLAAPDMPGTGLHFNFQLIDDLHDEKNWQSKPLRDYCKRFLMDRVSTKMRRWTMPNALFPPKMLVIGTPYHFDDAYHFLEHDLAKDEIDTFIVGMFGEPGLDIKDDNPAEQAARCIFPEQFPPEEIRRTRKEAKDRWASQYLIHPNPESQARFRRPDLLWYDGNMPKTRNYWYYTAVDPNRTDEGTGDWGVVATYAIDSSGHIWQAEQFRSRTVDIDGLKEKILEQILRWQPMKVLIESVGYQWMLFKKVRDSIMELEFPCWVEEVKRGGVGKKIPRIGAMVDLVASKMLHLLHGVGEVTAIELEQFPHGSHDDTLDVLADIYHKCKRPPTPEKEEKAKVFNRYTAAVIQPEMFPDFVDPSGRRDAIRMNGFKNRMIG